MAFQPAAPTSSAAPENSSNLLNELLYRARIKLHSQKAIHIIIKKRKKTLLLLYQCTVFS